MSAQRHHDRRRKVSLALAATLAILATGSARAQYVGPTTHPTATSVAAILKNPVDDQRVVLQGVLLRQVGKEKYIFSDGSGEIRVEIENERFPAQKIDEKTRIEIRGEVEKEFLTGPEIDVDAIAPAS